MSVLAIETATTVCAAAVVHEGRILGEASLDEKYVHAEKLMTLVDSVLHQSGLSLPQVGGIAISIGPGSFTGLRIGLSVAKGLAFADEKHLLAVPTLQALAQRVVDEKIAAEGEHILAALDARRDEVYCQWFKSEGSHATPRGPERDMLATHVLGESPEGRVFITGDALGKLQEAIGNRHPEVQWSIVPAGVARCSASVVARIGEAMMAQGEFADQSTLEPRYIKEFFFRQHS